MKFPLVLRVTLSICFFILTPLLKAEVKQADVIVYGGTAGGVMAGIAATKQGANVLILEPGNHVGGMLTSGLGRTDMDRQQHVIGGLSLEFFRRVGAHYGKGAGWMFEPHVAEKVMNAMLAEHDVTMLFGKSLDSVVKENGRIRSLKTTDGDDYVANVFIDASYEGDLMAKAGVSYTFGREGKERYQESLAGRREILRGKHQLNHKISPFKDGKLLPHITAEEDLAPVGAGDGKIQSYCFRLCLTDVPENRISIEKPEGYDPARYELLRRCFEVDGEKVVGSLGIKKMPNGKSDVNSGWGISLNLLGANQDYPDATPKRRKEIWDEHMSWTHGMVYYLQNDPSVPVNTRKFYREWGLCKDEFTDNGGWPHQLYIREARRMLGEHVLTQHDLMTQHRKYDCIGIAGYNIDIREVQWVALRTFYFPNVTDEVYMEGYLSHPVEPWDIPYRAMLPRYSECQNLLVPVCISASTIAYASFRMEPQYMIAGQSAGVAAAIASEKVIPVHRVPMDALQEALIREGQIIKLP